MAHVKQRRESSSRDRAVQIARVVAAATGEPELNRAQRRAVEREQRKSGR